MSIFSIININKERPKIVTNWHHSRTRIKHIRTISFTIICLVYSTKLEVGGIMFPQWCRHEHFRWFAILIIIFSRYPVLMQWLLMYSATPILPSSLWHSFELISFRFMFICNMTVLLNMLKFLEILTKMRYTLIVNPFLKHTSRCILGNCFN